MDIRKEFINNYSTSDEVLKMAQLIVQIDKFGLGVEVIHTALMEMKNNPKSSPLLCLQIAANSWDI